jgi:hypothetical protein
VRKHTMVRPRIEFDATLPESTGAYKVRRWADERERLHAAARESADE